MPEINEPDVVLPSCDVVVFGDTGELALHTLIPALYHREREHGLHPATRIIGVSRLDADDAGYRDLVGEALFDTIPDTELEAGALHRILSRIRHLHLDAGSADRWDLLHGILKEAEETPEQPLRIYYLAVAPDLVGPICDRLDDLGLVTPTSRVVIEKPIGTDLASSRLVNDAVARVFDEGQVFRIDHKLGKESVQNLLVTRFANTFLEPLWNSGWVDHVQITVAEDIGVAARPDYHDEVGTLRDMVQDHLLQLLCLVAMEPPTYVRPETVRDERLKVLQALRPLAGDDVDRDTVRGQYVAGGGDGSPLSSYADDAGVVDSSTETFVALRAEISNWRWAGVPFYLRTGKRLGRRESRIDVVFKEPPHTMFPGSTGGTTPNRLTIRMQPEEGMQLHLTAKIPGPGGIRLRPVSLDLSYATAFDERIPGPYERLLMDVIRGNPTFFLRRDELEAAWRWVEPIADHWSGRTDGPDPYPAGSTGPIAAATLLERDGRSWQEDA